MAKGLSQTGVKATREDLIRENESLRGEVDRLRNSRLASNVTAVLLQTVRWAGVCVVAYFAYRIVGEMAGKQTLFDASVRADLSEKLGESVKAKLQQCSSAGSYVKGVVSLLAMVVVGSIWYLRRARRLVKSTIQRMSPYRKLYEEALNPARASSGLQEDGSTRDEDAL